MKEIIKKFPVDWLVMLIIIIVTKSFLILSAFLSAAVVEAMLQLDLQMVFKQSLNLLFVYLLFLASTYCEIRYRSRIKQKTTLYLRQRLASDLTQLSYSDFKKRDSTSYVSWFNNDIDQIGENSINTFIQILANIIEAILAMAGLFALHYSLIVTALIACIILISIPKLISNYIGQANLALAQSKEYFINRVTDILLGFDTLYVFLQNKFFRSSITNASEHLRQHEDRYNKAIAIVAVIGGLGNILSQVSILTLTAYLAVQGVIAASSIVATTNLAAKVFNVVGNLSQYLAIFNGAKPIIAKLEQVRPEPNQIEKTSDGTITFSDKQGIVISNLSYAYGDKVVFSDLNYHFYAGGKFAVLGDSGSGKSTLLNVLTGKLSDYHGSASLNGQEIKELTPSEIFQTIAYLEQNPYFFNLSIKDNLLLGDDYSEEDLWTALEKVDLDELVSSLPDKLNTPLGEDGSNLSGGQLQRVALARAFLRNKPILIIDEATAHLDEASALKIEEMIINQPELTVIIISHHLSPHIKDQLDGYLTLE